MSGDLAGHVMDMLQLYDLPQLPDSTIYQQDRAPLTLPTFFAYSSMNNSLQDGSEEDHRTSQDLPDHQT